MGIAVRDLRIGIPIIGTQNWLGGVSYVESLVTSIHLLPEMERPRVVLIVRETFLDAVSLHERLLPLAEKIIFLGEDTVGAGRSINAPFVHCRSVQDLFAHIDFFFPVVMDVIPDYCAGSWIPDFQHNHLPDFFSASERASRDAAIQKIALQAKLLVLSSQDAERDFRKFFPHSMAEIGIHHFHTLPDGKWYTPDPASVQKKYGLPDEFLICCNQFRPLKNHMKLFEALLLFYHQTERHIHLVCTGSPEDNQSPDYFNRLLHMIESSPLKPYVHILGIIPRIDQIQLLRRSMAVIQPSLFEGWSTTVEDARALGKTMILSDLAVHKEQAPPGAVYFHRNDSGDLALKITDLLPGLTPGPDTTKEQEARSNAERVCVQTGRRLCIIAADACSLANSVRARSLSPTAHCGGKTGSSGSFRKSVRMGKNFIYPKISIITPSLNQGQYLEECIESILGQNYPNLEYIIMDGGSTDNSVEIIRKYEPYLTYWQSKPDGGQYPAINEGFKRASGEILTWLNSDDKYHPYALFKVAYVFTSSPQIEWLTGRPAYWDSAGRLQSLEPVQPVWTREMFLRKNIRLPIRPESTFWRRRLWEKSGETLRTDLLLASDLDLWMKFFRHAPLYSVNALLGGYRTHGNQKAQLYRDLYVQEAFKVVDDEIALYQGSADKKLIPAPIPLEVPAGFSAPEDGSEGLRNCWNRYKEDLENFLKISESRKLHSTSCLLRREMAYL